jgi:hypothetical protein
MHKASDRLLAAVPLITAELRFTGICGLRGAKIGSTDEELLRELGKVLLAVLGGQPAKMVSRQNERKKRRK